MSTKKDYIRAAKLIAAMPAHKRNDTILAFILFFQEENPRFDAPRFETACFLEVCK